MAGDRETLEAVAASRVGHGPASVDADCGEALELREAALGLAERSRSLRCYRIPVAAHPLSSWQDGAPIRLILLGEGSPLRQSAQAQPLQVRFEAVRIDPKQRLVKRLQLGHCCIRVHCQ